MAKINFSEKKNFFSKLGRKNLILLCAVLVIGAAVYLNYRFFYKGANPGEGTQASSIENNDGNKQESVTSGGDTYFTATQLSRKMARDEALEVLQTVLDNENALSATKAKALEDMARIASEIEKEANIEALITAKGFEQCIAVINGDKVSIVVKNDGALRSNQLAQINEIVYSETGIKPTNIKIIQK